MVILYSEEVHKHFFLRPDLHELLNFFFNEEIKTRCASKATTNGLRVSRLFWLFSEGLQINKTTPTESFKVRLVHSRMLSNLRSSML